MKGLKDKASISFKEFDLARVNNFKDCEKASEYYEKSLEISRSLIQDVSNLVVNETIRLSIQN